MHVYLDNDLEPRDPLITGSTLGSLAALGNVSLRVDLAVCSQLDLQSC
jgi:hypothetical protein